VFIVDATGCKYKFVLKKQTTVKG
jgi:hypothetical protein